MKKIFALFIISILTMGAGYEGTLPDLESEMSYKLKSKKVKYPPLKQSDEEPKLQKVPKEDKDYVDIIVKKNRTAEYIKDIQPIITLLEKFKTYIEDEQNIQMFNAIASNYIDHAYYIKNKYANRPEHFYVSYRAMVALAEETRNLAMLKSEGLVYTRYVPYSADGQKYSPANMKTYSDKLLKQIYETLYVLKNLD
jgi:hypothetical protein